jgi:hypothetical protein
MTPPGYKVPTRTGRKNKYEVVWRYLETVEEYETIPILRMELVKRFGGNATPSHSELHRHLQINREGNR